MDQPGKLVDLIGNYLQSKTEPSSSSLVASVIPPNRGPSKNRSGKTSALNVEIQWTVRPRRKLSQYEESMTLKYLVAEVLNDGQWGLENFLMAFYLLDRLSRSGYVRKIRDTRTNFVCLSAYIVLKYFPYEEIQYPEGLLNSIKELLTDPCYPVIFSRRALGGISKRFYPRDNLEVRAEPLEKLLERSGSSIRYSGYCKGYGEGGSLSARTRRTRPSAELDGETEDRPERFDPYGTSLVIRLIQLLGEYGISEMPVEIL